MVSSPPRVSLVVKRPSRCVGSGRQAFLEYQEWSVCSFKVSGVVGSPMECWEWLAASFRVSGVVSSPSQSVGSGR